MWNKLENGHMCYPSFKKVDQRKKSYPPWFDLQNPVESSTLAENGHFFNDLRLLMPITSCYMCGETIKWQKLEDIKYHEDNCGSSAENKALARNNLVKNVMRTRCDWVILILGGLFNLVVITHSLILAGLILHGKKSLHI